MTVRRYDCTLDMQAANLAIALALGDVLELALEFVRQLRSSRLETVVYFTRLCTMIHSKVDFMVLGSLIYRVVWVVSHIPNQCGSVIGSIFLRDMR
jgi:hypothetical protein